MTNMDTALENMATSKQTEKVLEVSIPELTRMLKQEQGEFFVYFEFEEGETNGRAKGYI